MKIFATSFFAILFLQSAHAYVNIKKQTKQAIKDFENTYHTMHTKHFFEHHYEDQPIINFSLDTNFPESGKNLLKLISWLEQKSDPKSIVLLKEINRICALLFHKFICSLDMDRDHAAKLYSTFYTLLKHKSSVLDDTNSTKSLHISHYFQSTLSKIIIFTYTIGYSQNSYREQRENLVLNLEGYKEELLTKNEKLTNKVDNEIIATFISILEVNSLQEPLIKARSIKRILMIGCIALVITCCIAYIVYKGGLSWLGQCWNNFWTDTHNKSIKLTDEISKILAKNVVDEMERRGRPLRQEIFNVIDTSSEILARNTLNQLESRVENIGRNLVNGIAYSEQTHNNNHGIPNNAPGILLNQTIHSLLERNDNQQERINSNNNNNNNKPMSTTEQLGHQLGDAVIQGALDKCSNMKFPIGPTVRYFTTNNRTSPDIQPLTHNNLNNSTTHSSENDDNASSTSGLSDGSIRDILSD